ncbi:retrovirus-related pol polyprotein from transposon TNT 1-94, partial [Tanacetum coccineum]
SYALSWKPCQGDSLNLPDHRAQVDQGSQIKMIQVKEMMQDNDLKNSKSKDKGSKSRSQSMDEQSHYKQDKTITRQSINVKRHIFNVIGGTEEFEERDLNIGGDSKYVLARGNPKLKFQKDHLCSAFALGKSKKSSHQPKAEDTNQEKLYLLHIDLCGPMRVESIHEKKYILVIVDDYSRFTWVKFLRSKDEAPNAIIKCIKNIQIRLNATVCNVRIDNGTEFVNQTLPEFYENVDISHQTSVACTP